MTMMKKLRRMTALLFAAVLCLAGFAAAESAEPLHLYIIVSDYDAGTLLSTQRDSYAAFLMNTVGVLQDAGVPFDISMTTVQGDGFSRYDAGSAESPAVWVYESMLKMQPAGQDITKNTGEKISQAVNEGGSNSVVLLLFGNDMKKFSNMTVSAENSAKVLFVGDAGTDIRKLNDACSSLGGVAVASNEGISLDGAGSVALAKWMTGDAIDGTDFAYYRIEEANSNLISFDADNGIMELACGARGISDFAAVLSCPDGEIVPQSENDATVIAQGNENVLVLPNKSVFGKQNVSVTAPSETTVLNVIVRSDDGSSFKKNVAIVEEALQTETEENKESFKVGDKVKYTLTVAQDTLNIATENKIELYAYVEGTDANGNSVRGEEIPIALKEGTEVQVPIPASGKNTLYVTGTDFVNPISVMTLNADNTKPMFAEGVESEENIGTIVCFPNMAVHNIDLSVYFTDEETPDSLTFQVEENSTWTDVEAVYPISMNPGKGSAQVRTFDGDKYSDSITLAWQVVTGESALESPTLTLPSDSGEEIYAGENKTATITLSIENVMSGAGNAEEIKDYLCGLKAELVLGEEHFEAKGAPEISESACVWTVDFTAPTDYENHDCVGVLLDGETEYKTDVKGLTATNKQLRWKSESETCETEFSTLISKQDGIIEINIADLLDESSIESNDGCCTLVLESDGIQFTESEEDGVCILTQSDATGAKVKFEYTWDASAPVIRLTLNKVTEKSIQPSASGSIALTVRDGHTKTDDAVMQLNFKAVDKKLTYALIIAVAVIALLIVILLVRGIKRAKKKAFGSAEITIVYKDRQGNEIAGGSCVAEAWGKGDISLLQLALLAKLPATNIIRARQMKNIYITRVKDGFKVSGLDGVEVGNPIVLPGDGGKIEISSK